MSNRPPSGSPGGSDPLSPTVTAPTVTIDGVAATVAFSGITPGFVGLYQVDVQVLPTPPRAMPFR
ncbi:MAG TPA: hypothetical protein VNN17_11505 [Terriglobia bacterium]|nr:hypothetical protein [Terriglobia bacterium]